MSGQARRIAAVRQAIQAVAGVDGNAYATVAVLAAYTNGYHYSARTMQRAIHEALEERAISVGDRWQRQQLEGNRWEWRQIGSVYRADDQAQLLTPIPLARQNGALPSPPTWRGGFLGPSNPPIGLGTGRSRAIPQAANLAGLGGNDPHKLREGDIIMSPREFRPDPKPAKQVTGEKVPKPGGKVGLKRARMAEPAVEVVPEEPEWRRIAAAPPVPVTDGSRSPDRPRFLTAAEKREEKHQRVQERVRRRAEERLRQGEP